MKFGLQLPIPTAGTQTPVDLQPETETAYFTPLTFGDWDNTARHLPVQIRHALKPGLGPQARFCTLLRKCVK